MNSDFSRILTLLRKENGYSQKKVAQDLGISQALLSHYEKGVRECGLNFVVQVSDYYNVSCDYLLGKAPNPEPDTKPADTPTPPNRTRYHTVVYSLNILFSILKKINSERLSAEVCTYLYASIYKIFRVLGISSIKSPQNIFVSDNRVFGVALESIISMSEAKSRYILSGNYHNSNAGIKRDLLPILTKKSLSEDFPQYADALFSLVKTIDGIVQKDIDL